MQDFLMTLNLGPDIVGFFVDHVKIPKASKKLLGLLLYLNLLFFGGLEYFGGEGLLYGIIFCTAGVAMFMEIAHSTFRLPIIALWILGGWLGYMLVGTLLLSSMSFIGVLFTLLLLTPIILSPYLLTYTVIRGILDLDNSVEDFVVYLVKGKTHGRS